MELIIGKEQYSLIDRQQGGKDLLKRGFLGGRDEGAIDAGLEALQLEVMAQAERVRQDRVEQQATGGTGAPTASGGAGAKASRGAATAGRVGAAAVGGSTPSWKTSGS